jgi:exonuclease SbcC
MLPIKLTIQGINSYQEKQEIDFSPLLANKIFGIFGNTGSGKSTIPEAISFVLYDKMERMNKADGLNYNIMNLKSDKMLIEFEFESENSEKYKFRVEGRRNGRNFEDVTLKRAKYKWTENEWIPEENLNAEEIIGLNYDNFKRTIIIPQNRFMDFIQLGDKDRTKMMKEIFGLEKYDLLWKVYELEKDNNNNISRLNGLLENLQDISKDAITQKEKEKSDAEINKNKLNQDLVKLDAEFKKMENTRQMFDELTIKQSEYEKLAESEKTIQKLNEDLKKYNICILNFKNPLDRKSNLNQQLKLSNDLKKQLGEKIDKANTQKEITDQQLFELKQQFDQIDKYKTENEEIKKLISIKKTDLELPHLEKQIEKNEINLDQLLTKVKDSDNTISDRRLAIGEKEKNMPDFSVLNEIQRWFDSYDHHLNSKKDIEARISLINGHLSKIEEKKLDHLSSHELSKIKIDLSLDPAPIIEILRSKTEEYEKGLSSIISEKDDLMLKLRLKEFAHSLTDGSPCPVCGSLDHPEPLKAGNIEIRLKETQERIKKGEDIIKQINNKIEKFKEMSIELSSEKKQLEDLNKSHKQKENDIKTHLSLFNWKGYSPENRELVKEKIILANKMNDEIKKCRTDIEELEKSKKELEIKRENLTEEKLKLQNNYQGKRSEKDTLVKQLSILKYEDHREKTTDELKDWQTKSTLFIEEITEKYNKTSKYNDELKTEIIQLKAENESNDKIIDQHEKELSILADEILDKLHFHKFESEEQVLDILDLKIDSESAQKKINNFYREYQNLKDRINDLKAKLEDRSFDKDAYDEMKKKIDEFTTEISRITKQLGAIENTISDWKHRLNQKINYTKELKDLELRKEDLNVMRSLFKANGFVKYVSMMKMQELVNYANSRFHKLTRGSLSLDFNNNGSFTVIDHLNDGKKRNIKTLSGGQLFQASLSMALALAGVVQQQNKTKQNFFFLDEGFGTLDAQSLNLVFDTISELRKENRSVGFISHVTELREGMSTYLETIYEQNTGSRIIKSWEK